MFSQHQILVSRRRRFVLLITVLFVAYAPSAYSYRDWTDVPLPYVPTVDSLSAHVLDHETGDVLFSHNADEVIAPASMTKLVTMHIVLEEVRAGRLALDDLIGIPPSAYSQNAPPRSSLMFLGPRQQATVHDLLLGLAVTSGNDAAVAAALLIEPSVELFIERMNREMDELGLENTRFVEPSGYSPFNRTTAREFAAFARYYIERHPEATREFHNVRTFSYPRQENLIAGNREHAIFQMNTNRLLWLMPEADGLKTGTITSSGFNLAATAARDGRRVIAVVMGVRAQRNANELRALIARELLEYGLSGFIRVEPEAPELPPVRVAGGAEIHVNPSIDGWSNGAGLLVPTAYASDVSVHVEVIDSVRAPVPGGAVLGHVVITSGETELHRFAVLPEHDVADGPWWRRLWDAISIRIAAIFSGEKVPPRASDLVV